MSEGLGKHHGWGSSHMSSSSSHSRQHGYGPRSKLKEKYGENSMMWMVGIVVFIIIVIIIFVLIWWLTPAPATTTANEREYN